MWDFLLAFPLRATFRLIASFDLTYTIRRSSHFLHGLHSGSRPNLRPCIDNRSRTTLHNEQDGMQWILLNFLSWPVRVAPQLLCRSEQKNVHPDPGKETREKQLVETFGYDYEAISIALLLETSEDLLPSPPPFWGFSGRNNYWSTADCEIPSTHSNLSGSETETLPLIAEMNGRGGCVVYKLRLNREYYISRDFPHLRATHPSNKFPSKSTRIPRVIHFAIIRRTG